MILQKVYYYLSLNDLIGIIEIFSIILNNRFNKGMMMITNKETINC